MPEINIPGVTASRYKTDELVDGLMRIERIPRDRADEQLSLYRDQQTAWRQLSRQVSTLRDSARALYSYNNPFTEKIGSSSNSAAVTVTATREAQEQSFSVSVLQKAAADSFLSREIPRDATVPAGSYIFGVGDKKIEFSWKGGSYSDFVQSLNRRGQGTIRAQLIQTAPNKRALLIESLKTGADMRLSFDGAALDLALETGLIEKGGGDSVSVSETEAEVAPASSKVIAFSSALSPSASRVLEYTVSVSPAPDDAESLQPAGEAASGPQLPLPGSITYEGITVVNAESETYLAALMPPPAPPPQVETNSVLSLRSASGASVPLPDVPQSGSQTFTVPLSEDTVDALVVSNGNTGRSISISGIKVYDTAAEGDFVPVNSVSRAQDAIVQYEGITITRPNNSIDDLVPGVTIAVHETTERPARISIDPDREAVKDAIISFVANYNRVIAEINILTQNKPEIIEEIQYFTADEREQAEQKLGMMQGETTLNTLKNALQRIMSDPYTADEASSFVLLAQIGISTRAGSGGGIDSSRLRGYLEIDEELLDRALETSIASVKSLFGYDSDGDLIIDSGAAIAIDNNATPYVQTGGIFATRTAGLDTRISETERRITQLDEQLDRRESDLRRQYSQMEGALNQLESQSDSISNFNRRNSRQD